MHRTFSHTRPSSSKRELSSRSTIVNKDTTRHHSFKEVKICRQYVTSTHSLCTFLFCVTTCMLAFLHMTHAQFLETSQDCQSVNSEGSIVYKACIGSPEKLFLLDVTTTLDPPNATCGSNPDQDLNLFCTLVSNTFGWNRQSNFEGNWRAFFQNSLSPLFGQIELSILVLIEVIVSITQRLLVQNSLIYSPTPPNTPPLRLRPNTPTPHPVTTIQTPLTHSLTYSPTPPPHLHCTSVQHTHPHTQWLPFKSH